MADNISPEEVKRRLILFLRIPAEVWTDVLKTIPRSILVKNIAPVCFRLKEISDKNVKSIHVIENANQLNKKLVENETEANQQMEKLAANKCQLSSQFKLTKVRISEQSKAILSHCSDLLNGCQITLDINGENKDSELFLECLGLLKEAKPAEIRVNQHVDQLVDYWHHPTFLKCTRVDLDFWSPFGNATTKTAVENIFDWLHHKPIGKDGSIADQKIRCMIVWNSNLNHIELLINRCSEDIQQCQQPIDRRPFVLSFLCWDWPGFGQFHRIENKSTGEVLVLERKMRANGHPTDHYRLRRCLAEEEANGVDFYAGLFKRDYVADVFNIGDETPEVMIK